MQSHFTSRLALTTAADEVPLRGSRRWALIAFASASVLAACGSSSTSSPTASATAAPISTPTSTPIAQAASAQCPTAASVGSALGVTLPNPTSVAPGTQLPAGATGVVCNYLGQSFDVLVEIVVNLSQSYIAQGEQAVNARSSSAHFTNLPGVGDQAVSYSYSLGGGSKATGVLAAKGTTFVGVFATRTPASLNQIESLVKQLLG